MSEIKVEIISCFVYLLLAFGIWMPIDLFYLFQRYSIKTTGVVIELVSRYSTSSTGSRNRVVYAPQVEFTSGSQVYQFTDDLWSSQSKYSKGEVVAVEYLKGYESNARIPSKWRSIAIWLFFVFSIAAAVATVERLGFSYPGMGVFIVANIALYASISRRYKAVRQNR